MQLIDQSDFSLMEAKNTKSSPSPLYSEIKNFIWTMEYMRNLRQFTVTFATDYL